MSFGGLSTDFTNSFLSHLELNQHYTLTHLSSQWIHPCLSSPLNSSEFWKLQLSQICAAQEQQSFAGTTFRRRPVHQRSVRLGTRQFRSEEPMNQRRNGVTKGRISKRETSTYLSVRHLGLGRQNAEQTQCSFSRDLIC
jgi:hypothetical protein